MRFWKPQLAVATATSAVVALTAIVFLRGVVDALVMILIGAALVGMYLLRRYARAELLYHRHTESRRPAHRTEPGQVWNVPPAGQGDPTKSGGTSAVTLEPSSGRPVADRDVMPAGASLRRR